MSVLLETSLGDIVIDLLIDSAPKCCEKYVKFFIPATSLVQPSKIWLGMFTN